MGNELIPVTPLASELAKWITMREVVRINKDRGMEPPWSADSIMNTTRFTNVRREHDRVTEWVAAFWRNPYVGNAHLIPALVVARMVNKPETLYEIGFPIMLWGPDFEKKFYSVIRRKQKAHEVTWGNAYMITTCGQRVSKEEYVYGVANFTRMMVFQAHTTNDMVPLSSLDAMHKFLMRVPGLGSFLAAQVVADLKNTPGHPLELAPDWFTWAASGPGSRKGLNYYFGRPPETSYPEGKWRREILTAWGQVKPLLPEGLQDIHMQDFQNCLCEFSKYMRIQNGGRAKNRYIARRAPLARALR